MGLRHHYFRFIMVSVSKANFLYKIEIHVTSIQVADLRGFLQEWGVSCSFHRIYHLERLYKLANEMSLELMLNLIDTYKKFDLSRRTYRKSNTIF